jgi:hypothetical protein
MLLSAGGTDVGINKYELENMEGSARGLFEVPAWHLPQGTSMTVANL